MTAYICSLKVNLPLNGRTWAIAESIEAGELASISSPSPLPPAVVTQHAHPPRQFILVSIQGSYLISKQRPVDQLHYLLESGKGGGSDAIRAFFKLYRVRCSHSSELCNMECLYVGDTGVCNVPYFSHWS